MKPKLCVSSSVIGFRPKAEKIWGLERYKWPRDIFKPVVFFGMYHIGDYFHYTRHLGKKTIFWCGSDIQYLMNGRYPRYNINDEKTKHYCENEIERMELDNMGIKAEVKPSFLEDVNDFPVSFKPSKNPEIYLSIHPDREREYGLALVLWLSPQFPDYKFHIYGHKGFYAWAKLGDMIVRISPLHNIYFHGQVPEKQFNEEIKNYHCGFRPNLHDGASEIMIKSVLLGQYPITHIQYPMIDNSRTREELVILFKDLKNKKEPNLKAREFWRKNVNQFAWIHGEY